MTDLPIKWGDAQQFYAEPHSDYDETVGILPTIYLQWMTPDPLGAIATMSEMYKGNVIRSHRDVTDVMREEALADVQKTHLQAPLEAVKIHFMIDGLDRALEQQLTRQRTAVYAAESLRFAVVEDLPRGTSLPPSLHGTPITGEASDYIPDSSREVRWRTRWDACLREIEETYTYLVNDGMPAEEARGLLPLCTATRTNYVTDLLNLSRQAGNRLCTQAQFHWRLVFGSIAKAIQDAMWTPGGPMIGRDLPQNAWQYEKLGKSGLFRPVCYQLGHCPFNASFDRACTIRERVEIRAKHGGNDPDQWHKPFLYFDVDEDDQRQTVTSEGINPKEWLLDPGAARR